MPSRNHCKSTHFFESVQAEGGFFFSKAAHFGNLVGEGVEAEGVEKTS